MYVVPTKKAVHHISKFQNIRLPIEMPSEGVDLKAFRFTDTFFYAVSEHICVKQTFYFLTESIFIFPVLFYVLFTKKLKNINFHFSPIKGRVVLTKFAL